LILVWTNKIRKQRGAVLILALWALSLLTVFAVNLGVYVRQKAKLLERLEHRQELRLIAESGIFRAIVLVVEDFKTNLEDDPILRKRVRHNNKDEFKDVRVGRGRFSIAYRVYDNPQDLNTVRYGISDEQGRININTADRKVLSRLIEAVLGKDSIAADKIATGIVDWRQLGESEIVGFFSDEYYSQLDQPYKPTKSRFQMLEEIKQVKFISEADYFKLKDFITVYGDGRVNANTASRVALIAIGLTSELADKVIYVRKGPDGLEATNDDIIFNAPGSVGGQVAEITGLTEDEGKLFAELASQGLLGAHTGIYRVDCEAGYDFAPKEKKVLTCVFDAKSGKIVYWRDI